MISVVVEEKKYTDKIIISNKSDINHLKNVFRLKVGDKIRVVDGKFEYISCICKIENDFIEVDVLEKNEDSFSLEIDIDAAISLIKNDKMDICIQKLAEIGIKNFIPISTRRCVVKLDKKKERWDKIVNETMKQCRGVNPMKIADVISLDKINFSEYSHIVVPYECADNFTLKNLIKEIKDVKKILYIIGPEGGFETDEVEFLKTKGAFIVTLGKRILRAETAAIVTGGVLVNEFQ